jgi:hypothetical protein
MLVGFLLVAYLQVGLGGILIARRPGRLLIAAGVTMTVACVGLWILSRTTGLASIGGEAVEPIGFKDGVCVLFEIATLPALLLLASSDLLEVPLPSPRLGTHGLGLLGAGITALFVPALFLDAGHHHSHEALHALGHPPGQAGHAVGHASAAQHASTPGGAHPGHVHVLAATAGGHSHAWHAHAQAGHAAHQHGAGGQLLAGVLPGHAGHVHVPGTAGGQPFHRHGGGVKHRTGHTHGNAGNGHRHDGQHPPGDGNGHPGHTQPGPAGEGHHHEPEPQPENPVEAVSRQVTELLPPRR